MPKAEEDPEQKSSCRAPSAPSSARPASAADVLNKLRDSTVGLLSRFVYFVDLPDQWEQADTVEGRPYRVEWEQEAKKRLSEFAIVVRKLDGPKLDSIRREAERLQKDTVPEASQVDHDRYRLRHRQMYLPNLLSLIQGEIKRRGNELMPSVDGQLAEEPTNEASPVPKQPAQRKRGASVNELTQDRYKLIRELFRSLKLRGLDRDARMKMALAMDERRERKEFRANIPLEWLRAGSPNSWKLIQQDHHWDSNHFRHLLRNALKHK